MKIIERDMISHPTYPFSGGFYMNFILDVPFLCEKKREDVDP